MKNPTPSPIIRCHQQCDKLVSFDCDCACAYSVQPQAHVVRLEQRHEAAPASIMQLNQDWTVVYVPGSKLAVLNSEAERIWRMFMDAPLRPVEAPRRLQECPPTSIHKTVMDLAHLGFIRPVDDTLISVSTTNDTLNVWLQLTERCNLACDYCYAHHSNAEMSPAVLRDSIQNVVRLAQLHDYRRLRIKYGGGEPTLCFTRLLTAHDTLVECTSEAELDLEAVLLTNGVDITDAMLRACEQRSIRLAVSLDGGPVGHNRVRRFPNGQGTYKKVLETIECALAYTIPVSLSITLTSQNLVDVEAAVKYAMERDIPFNLNFVRILDAAPKNPLVPDINALIDVVERCFQVAKSCLDHYSSPLTGILDRVHFDLPHAYACAAGRHYLAIDTQGHISPCQMLLSNPWGRLDQQVSLQNLRARSTEVFGPTVNKASDCRTCFWKYACGGGCPLLRNSVLHNQYCEVYRNLLPTLVRLEGLRLLKSASHIYGRGH